MKGSTAGPSCLISIAAMTWIHETEISGTIKDKLNRQKRIVA
jgi:hypothetical protein